MVSRIEDGGVGQDEGADNCLEDLSTRLPNPTRDWLQMQGGAWRAKSADRFELLHDR